MADWWIARTRAAVAGISTSLFRATVAYAIVTACVFVGWNLGPAAVSSCLPRLAIEQAAACGLLAVALRYCLGGRAGSR